MNQKHNVYFSLDPIPNGLSKDGRSLGYKARMHPRETLDLRTILENDDQCRRVGPDMLAHHLEMALNAVKREALRSGSICRVGDFFTAEVNVTGRFDGEDDRFDPERGHGLAFSLKLGKAFKALKPDEIGLQPVNECRPRFARIGNALSLGVATARSNRLVHGRDISIVGANLDFLDGDEALWEVQLPGELDADRKWIRGETLTGRFEVLESDATRMVVKWPADIPERAIGRTLRFVLVSRAGNPNAVSREVVRLWPIVAS